MGKGMEKLLKNIDEMRKDSDKYKGSLVIVDYYHDDWCPCSDGTHSMGSCICDPEEGPRNRQERRKRR